MKHSRLTIIALSLALLMPLASLGQQRGAYVGVNLMPNGVIYLPAPPDTLDVMFGRDLYLYHWGKSVRATERGDTAVNDANSSLTNLMDIYSTPFGLTLSQKNTPAIFTLLTNALATTAHGTTKCKQRYLRMRPCVRFHEEPYSGESFKETSYPSGHTVKGWSMALLLLEINPSAQDAILKRGYEYGQSRVIVGAHWQSDVDAARVVASACVARLHSIPKFLEELAAAKAEYQRLTNQLPTEAPELAAPSQPDTRWYTIDGLPATPDTRGIVVGSDGTKTFRP